MSVGELLDQRVILNQMDQTASDQLSELIIEDSLDSTNSAVQRIPVEKQHSMAIVAEQQTAGRGRRGRYWHSPKSGNLYLSLGWQFKQSIVDLGCLPLVVALSVARALSRIGLRGHCVKWPNDLLLDGKKLAGCLVEVQGDTKGPSHAVLGIGMNINMPAAEAPAIDQPWTDLQSYLPDCSRNQLVAVLLEELIMQLSLYAADGFKPFEQKWEQVDALKGKRVDIAAGNRILHGMVAGIDDKGALLLDTGSGILSLHSGEVSIMPLC
jgi:BirA family biotin operon repressor/biotin-[acetyl-CoA-carboxylase] ligase